MSHRSVRSGWRGEVSGEYETEDGLTIQWTAEVDCFYRPGRFSGPPENCYPDESEAQIISLQTQPAGLEDQIPEDDVLEAAWEAFDNARWDGEA